MAACTQAKIFQARLLALSPIDHYTIFGSNSGCIWVLERRTGRIVCTGIAHYDCAITNIFSLSNNELLSMTDKSAIVWKFDRIQLKKLYEIRGPFDGITANSCLIGAYDESTRYNSDARFLVCIMSV